MKKWIAVLLTAALLLAAVPGAFAEETKAELQVFTLSDITLPEDADTIRLTGGALYVTTEHIFYLTVSDGAGESVTVTVCSNEDTVGAALTALDLIGGEESEWGLYVKTISGITADYDTDGSYWAFYINGEYAPVGVDAAQIEDRATYAFAVEGGSQSFADAEEPEEGDPILLEDGGLYGAQGIGLLVALSDSEAVAAYIFTDRATVGETLQALNMIAGEEAEWGLYVKEINGIYADFDTDGTYWAFYIDDQYASAGVDSTPVVPGTAYCFLLDD